MADDLIQAVARAIRAIDWPPLWQLPQDDRENARYRIIARAAIAAVRAWDLQHPDEPAEASDG